MRRSREASHEERIAIVNRIRKIKRESPSVALVMSMWLLKEHEARALLSDAEGEYESV